MDMPPKLTEPPRAQETARLKRICVVSCALLIAALATLFCVVRITTYHPGLMEPVTVARRSDAPTLKAGQRVKVMSWNVQYLAGKEHIFWYDVQGDYRGPVDARPTPGDIQRTAQEVARIICDESPDIILFQELDDGSKRTDYENQLTLLLDLLPRTYSQWTEAFYHRARFIPDRHIWGAVGMKLVTLSKYRIQAAVRHQLPCLPKDLIARQFYFKRAVLETRFPVEKGRDLVIINTHFDAWAAGTQTSGKQVAAVQRMLTRLEQERSAWLLGGDFNCLAPGSAYEHLEHSARWEFDETTALTPLFERYESVPTVAEIEGKDHAQWHSHWKNGLPTPDRTIDFLFFSRSMRVGPHWVRQRDPGKADYLRISDHFPVISEMTLPPAQSATPMPVVKSDKISSDACPILLPPIYETDSTKRYHGTAAKD